jgi:predicted dehydrogenase
MSQFNRRRFLQASAATTMAAAVGPWKNTAMARGYRSLLEQPLIGYIGTGIRFHTALGPGGTQFGTCAAISDVDMLQAGRALQTIRDLHQSMNKPLVIDVHEDYRHVLDNRDIDVVFIATPDHWHTRPLIDAMKAGKDVYCEKPLTLTIKEGEQIEKVMKETGRIVQVGTQQRTEFDQMFAKAAAIVRDGRAGDIQRITVCVGGGRECDPLPIVDVPKNLNWDRWLGQCPLVDYRAADKVVDREGWGAGHPFSRTHRYYRWFYEYSGGKLTDWGAHHVDIAMLAMDKLKPGIGKITIEPVEVTHPVNFDNQGMPLEDDRFNTATRFNVRCRFEDGIEMVVRHTAQSDLGFDNGILFEGSKGRLLVNRGKLVGRPVDQLNDDPLPDDALDRLYGQPLPPSHIQNFVECVSARQQPIADVVSHNRMLNVCHAINIAMRLNKTVIFDPETRRFVDDELANSLVEREQRRGYEIDV